jgi:hypothetical protein
MQYSVNGHEYEGAALEPRRKIDEIKHARWYFACEDAILGHEGISILRVAQPRHSNPTFIWYALRLSHFHATTM